MPPKKSCHGRGGAFNASGGSSHECGPRYLDHQEATYHQTLIHYDWMKEVPSMSASSHENTSPKRKFSNWLDVRGDI